MKPILQNLVEMTGHRDHLRLEVARCSPRCNRLQRHGAGAFTGSVLCWTVNGTVGLVPDGWLGQWLSAGTEAQADPSVFAWLTCPHCTNAQGLRPSPVGQRAPRPVAARLDERQGAHLPGSDPGAPAVCGQKIDTITVFQVFQNYPSLLDYSERDALTGLFNRKTFDEQFARATTHETRTHALNCPATAGGLVAEGADRQWPGGHRPLPKW